MLKPADPLLRFVMCMSVALSLTCTPSNSSPDKPAADPPPDPPPQCIMPTYEFVDENGELAFICVFHDTSVLSWNGYGATVFHPYLDGFDVGLAIDLPTLCSGDIPVCTTEPTDRCVTPPQTWYVPDYGYALCRTNDGDDLLEFYTGEIGVGWEWIESWDITVVCRETSESSDEPEEPVRE